jgi:hypothetical protein
MPQVGLEPTILVFERVKTVRALDSTATPIGTRILPMGVNILFSQLIGIAFYLLKQTFLFETIFLSLQTETLVPVWLIIKINYLLKHTASVKPRVVKQTDINLKR